MTRLTIFDLDGTLIDSRLDLAASANAALAKVGLPLRSEAEIGSFVGEGARRLVEKAIAPRQELIEPALAAFLDHYSKHLLVRTTEYDGVRDVLDALTGTPLAVATNKPGPFAREILQRLGFLDRFVAVLGGGEGPRKPDPALLQRIMALAAAKPEETTFVGDSRVDVETARAAGTKLIAVRWGFGSLEELVTAGAREDELVETPRELAERFSRVR
jgi:phosphoglycolate phosphatase